MAKGNMFRGNFRQPGSRISPPDKRPTKDGRRPGRQPAETQPFGPRKKGSEPQIEVVQLAGFPDITERLEDYHPDFVQSLKKRINASPGIDNLVATILLNTLAGLPNNVVQPVKNYSRHERNYLDAQIAHYLKTISCLEVTFMGGGIIGFGDANSLGKFSQIQGYSVSNIYGLLETELWNLPAQYHIGYVSDPSLISGNLENLRERIIARLGEEKKQKFIDTVRSLKNLDETGELSEVTEHLKSLGDEEHDNPWYWGKIVDYLAEKQGLNESEQKALEAFRVMLDYEHMINDEYEKLPGPQQIVDRMASLLLPNGILLVSSHEQFELEGMSHIQSPPIIGMGRKTTEIQMYQKQA